jgi:hypothetical protein
MGDVHGAAPAAVVRRCAWRAVVAGDRVTLCERRAAAGREERSVLAGEQGWSARSDRASWALSSTWFLAGRLDLAVSRLEEAFRCLRPEVSLLACSSAVLRLEHDPGDAASEAAEKLLARARQALELVGNVPELRELTVAEVRLALRQQRPEQAHALLESVGEAGDAEP